MPGTRRRMASAIPAFAVTCIALAWGLGCGEPNRTIVLVTLDTTRADHLGCYGYERDTSPNLDQLAAESLVYDDALSTGTWTLPAHASLFTGKLTASHGARFDPKGALQLTTAITGPTAWDAYRARPLAVDETTLASILRDAGYETAAVVAGPWLKRIFGLDRGFDHYDDEGITSVNGRLAWSVTERALGWLRDSAGEGRPPRRFLFLNYFDAHEPYQPPAAFLAELAPETAAADAAAAKAIFEGPAGEGAASASLGPLIDRYDAEIRYADAQLGRLFEGMRELGIYDDAWIIVTADHGEMLGEHDERGHGDVPYQPVVRVPLIVKRPDAQAARIAEPVQLTDVLPMLLAGIGVPAPLGIQGETAPRTASRVVESRTLPGFATRGDWRAFYEGAFKLIENSTDRHLLFDLQGDPNEEHNLADAMPERLAAMRERLGQALAALPPPGSQPSPGAVDTETREALEQLGYLE